MKKIIIKVLCCLILISCEDDKSQKINQPIQQEVIKPFNEQYAIDILAIDKYLDEYYIENVSSELSISFKKIPNPNIDNKISIRNQSTFPLLNKLVTIQNVEHKIYYLSLRTGTQLSCNEQSNIVCSYKGLTIENKIVDSNDGFANLNLNQVIQGWKEIIPLFKSGNYTLNSDGSVNSSTDFGAGVMFLPSALGYYNVSRGQLIPKYSPLIFTFKLRHVE